MVGNRRTSRPAIAPCSATIGHGSMSSNDRSWPAGVASSSPAITRSCFRYSPGRFYLRLGRTSLDHVADAISRRRAENPQRHIEEETDDCQREDRHRDAEQAPNDAKNQLQREPGDKSEKGETNDAPEHDILRGVRCVCSVRLNVAQSFVL